MHASLIALALALGLRHPSDTTADDPRAVVRTAARAVQGDSVDAEQARWRTRLKRTPTDRAALLGLATLARLGYEYPVAEPLYRTLVARDSVSPDRYAAYARLGLAQALYEQGHNDDAEAQFQRARDVAHAVGDVLAEAEAMSQLAFTRARTRGVPAGLALLDSAAPLIPPSAFDLRAASAVRRAVLLGLAGRPEATAEAITSVELARRSGDARTEGRALRAYGKVLWYQGKTDSALVIFRQAEAPNRRAHDRSGLGTLLTDEATVLLGRGELGTVQLLMQRVLVEGEASHAADLTATAHVGLAAVATYVRDFGTATTHLEQALAINEAAGNPNGVMKVRQFLVSAALGAGDYTAARIQADTVEKYYRGMGEKTELSHALLVDAGIAMHERDWPAATRALDEAKSLLGTSPSAIWMEYGEGRLALLRGDRDGAERHLTSYLRGLDTALHVTRYDVRLQLAHIYAQRGELGRAEQEARSAWDEFDDWRSTLGDRELRLLAFQASPAEFEAMPFALTERDGSIASVLGALAAGGHVSAALELAERRRARALMEELVQRDALRADGASPAHARRSPWSDAHGVAPRVSAADVASAIPERTALLEFVTGSEGTPTTLFVVQRDGFHAHILESGEPIASRVARLAAMLESGDDPGALARTLGAALLDSAVAELAPGVTRLVIVPDGALHRVPWDALRLADGHWVVERFAVSVAPSAAVALALWRDDAARARRARPVRILAFGDPALPGEDTTRNAPIETYRSAFDSAGGLPRLRASADEARAVGRYATDAEVRLREKASASYLKHAPLTGFRVIHFATHALVDEGSMARTALALAPGDGESGFVGAADLAALTLDADLVVLSACRTARGVVLEGEGVQGLTAPLLQAGARSVVATGWRIPDRSTVPFVRDFYGALAGGRPVGDALRSAKLASLRRREPPGEWAAFTAVGDPLVVVPLRTPSSLSPSIALMAALAAIAAGAGGGAVYLVRRRRGRIGEARWTPPAVVARTHHR